MIAALGFLAATLSIAVIWPQVWRSCRHGRTLGLSPTSVWLAIALNSCWLTFGVLTANSAQIVTHVVVGTGNTAVLVALLVSQPHLRSWRTLLRNAAGAAGLLALAAGSVLAVAVLGARPTAVAATLGMVIVPIGAAAALPQPLRLLRDRTLEVSGVSPARWQLGAVAAALWLSYGWLIDQPAVWLGAGFGLGCSLLMCALLRGRRPARQVRIRTPAHPAVVPAHGCRVPVPARMALAVG